MMMTLFDDEQIHKAFENDIKQESAKNKAIFMIQKGKIAIDEIAEYFPELSEEDRKQIESQVLQRVWQKRSMVSLPFCGDATATPFVRVKTANRFPDWTSRGIKLPGNV